jgi:RimJ/RimL family protein N-acetyltransferase
MVHGILGERVRLVPFDTDRHFENAYQWINDPEVTEWVLVGDFPMSKLAEQAWFESMSAFREDNVSFAVETLDGIHIGFSGIHNIDWRQGTAITGTIIGDKTVWGQGFGSDAARTRAKYAFQTLGLRMLYSSVLQGNERSLRMQLRVGYRQTGCQPAKYWKRGAYRDEVLTALHPDWLT